MARPNPKTIAGDLVASLWPTTLWNERLDPTSSTRPDSAYSDEEEEPRDHKDRHHHKNINHYGSISSIDTDTDNNNHHGGDSGPSSPCPHSHSPLPSPPPSAYSSPYSPPSTTSSPPTKYLLPPPHQLLKQLLLLRSLCRCRYAPRSRKGRRRSRVSRLLSLLFIALIFATVIWLLLAHFYHLPFSLPLSAILGFFGFGPEDLGWIDPMAPRLVLPQGIYVGTTLDESRELPKRLDAFLGVPFAQSTAGDNRFRPPQRLEVASAGSDGKKRVFKAMRIGEVSPAGGQVGNGLGEDCLNANLYRPAGVVDEEVHGNFVAGGERGADQKRTLLPIVVYIHGGAFNGGNGNERNMASFVAWAKEPIIGVNFNYRVGALGFLPSPLMAREGLLNLGLKDQQMLLEWVRDNAEAFGGDPKNITIMGLSAGAHSIGHHIMHYAQSSKPAPFHKAILESGATTARAVLSATHPRHLIQFREFLLATGLDGVPEKDILTRFRQLPVETIVKASKYIWDLYEPSVTWPFQPVIDGPNAYTDDAADRDIVSSANAADKDPIIPDLPITSWRKGKHLRIPVLTGFNTDEATIFIPSDASTNSDFRAFFKALIPGLNSTDLDELESLYPDPVTHIMSPYRSVPEGKGRQWARLDAAYSHYAYICPVLQTAHFMSNSTMHDSGISVPVYVYHYSAKGAWGTANHGDEAPIVAHDVGFLGRNGGMPGLAGVSEAMHGAWWRFAASKEGRVDYNAATGDVASDDGGTLIWPRFISPFTREKSGTGVGEPQQREKEKRWLFGLGGGSGENAPGQVMIFGEGNDERRGSAGKMKPGTPAKVKTLTTLELDACRFWWSRVELSEGQGRRAGELAERRGGRVRAKL